MSDTCIVCLGDLGDIGQDNTLAVATGSPRPAPSESSLDQKGQLPTPDIDDVADSIAHLLPCGHYLHHECLKPWIERANSCPICRQTFNIVELSETVGGSISSSYPVQDKVQVAELDPSLIIEDYDDEEGETEPCPVCGEDDNEDVLLICDGCDLSWHTYCVGLNAVPVGHWYCENCENQRALDPYHSWQATRRQHHTADRRTRGQIRRGRAQQGVSDSQWARVWQSVWDRLNIDLDFPFDDDDEPFRTRDYQALQRRLQVAEQQGVGVRFRNAAFRAFAPHPTTRPTVATPEPESQEELRAWNAFEKAQEIDCNPNRRKRKSATASPAEPPIQPERKRKKPNTRRNVDLADAPDSAAESSRVQPRRLSPTNRSWRPIRENASAGPSFLQSLLKEVDVSSSMDNKGNGYRPSSMNTKTPGTDLSSPRPSSPALSLNPSNHSSPRASSATPPPYVGLRPSSPTPLTTNIEPIFPPPAPEFSPSSPQPEREGRPRQAQPKATSNGKAALLVGNSSPPTSRPRSQESSPTRADLSLSTKTDVQRMVAAALKPFYKNREVSKDQYTDINRSISRKLYDRVGHLGGLDDDNREDWEQVASDEVSKAVEALKT